MDSGLAASRLSGMTRNQSPEFRMTQKRYCEPAERQRTVDAVTWLVAQYGSDAGTESLHHAFMREHDGDSIAAQAEGGLSGAKPTSRGDWAIKTWARRSAPLPTLGLLMQKRGIWKMPAHSPGPDK
jgi:hypothetical protein